MRNRPKGEQDRGHHDKPDSTGEAAGEELEMDDWAQETWSSSPVVSGRRPAPNVLGRRRSADRIPKEIRLLLGRGAGTSHAASTGSSPNITIEPPHDRQAGQRRTRGTGRRHRATVTEQTA